MTKSSLPTSSDKAAALKLTPVSRETEARLDRYVDLLLAWQAKTNLVATSTLPHLWTRHISDSLQLLALAPMAKRWADFGSGGGFPGVGPARALAGNPDAGNHLVQRKGHKDCVPARAVAPLHQLIGFAEPSVKRGAKALFLKGQDVEAELTEATKYWNINPRLHSSRTGGHGWIVELDRIEPRASSP